MPAYKRILLKLSGEALMGDDAYGINRATIVRMVREVQEVTRLGCEVAVVIGGGHNFFGGGRGWGGGGPRPSHLHGRAAPPADRLVRPPSHRRGGSEPTRAG